MAQYWHNSCSTLLNYRLSLHHSRGKLIKTWTVACTRRLCLCKCKRARLDAYKLEHIGVGVCAWILFNDQVFVDFLVSSAYVRVFMLECMHTWVATLSVLRYGFHSECMFSIRRKSVKAGRE